MTKHTIETKEQERELFQFVNSCMNFLTDEPFYYYDDKRPWLLEHIKFKGKEVLRIETHFDESNNNLTCVDFTFTTGNTYYHIRIYYLIDGVPISGRKTIDYCNNYSLEFDEFFNALKLYLKSLKYQQTGKGLN